MLRPSGPFIVGQLGAISVQVGPRLGQLGGQVGAMLRPKCILGHRLAPFSAHNWSAFGSNEVSTEGPSGRHLNP
eukprot:6652947-Karenia_brevis.AAC.1